MYEGHKPSLTDKEREWLNAREFLPTPVAYDAGGGHTKGQRRPGHGFFELASCMYWLAREYWGGQWRITSGMRWPPKMRMMGINAFTKTYSDAAKRCSDIVNMHAIAGQWGKFVAIRLHDGGSDGVLYDSWSDAVRHQIDERYCTYFRVPPAGMEPREADALLRYSRWAYDHGYRPSSFGDVVPIMPNSMHDLNRVIAN
jgi:hypothetical protein